MNDQAMTPVDWDAEATEEFHAPAEREMRTISNPEAISILLDRLPRFEQKGDLNALLSTTRSLENCVNQDDYELAIGYGRDLVKLGDQVKELYDPFASAANQLHKGITGKRKELLDQINGEVTRMKNAALRYEQELERKRREEEDRIRREQEAKARQERERIEREAQEEAERLEAAGKAKEAQERLEEAALETEAIEQETANTVYVLPSSKPTTKQTGASTSIRWKVDEANVNLLELVKAAAADPDRYLAFLKLDLPAVNGVARSLKDKCKIPGVPVVQDRGMSFRR